MRVFEFVPKKSEPRPQTNEPPPPPVDLIAEKHKGDPPRLRIIIEIFDLPDGRLAYQSRVEERMWEGEGLSEARIRSWMGWAAEMFGRRWRLGLGRRARSGWPKERRRLRRTEGAE